MAQEPEKAGVTELQVRMDCNGCVQRIKRALHGIDGVHDVQIDLACQKLTVVGTADPEKIVKAIKKARKIATICSHREPGENTASEQPPPAEQPSSSDPPPPDGAANNPSSGEAPPAAPAEPTKDEGPPQDNSSPEVKPSPEAKDAETAEIHMVNHYYPFDHLHREQWNYYYPQTQEIMYEHPYHAGNGYNSYRAPPYVSQDGSYFRPPPQEVRYSTAAGAYDENGYYHHNRRGGDGNQITSIFSDENPNACSIV